MMRGVGSVDERLEARAIFAHEDDFILDLQDAPEGDHRFWGAHPRDELAYEAMISWLCGLATAMLAQKAEGDGAGASSERSDGRSPAVCRHAIVDWTNPREDTPLLQGKVPGGWIDPDCLHVGAFSRVRDDTRIELAPAPSEINVEFREWSFLTLDAPTWSEDPAALERTLFRRLIQPVVDLQGRGGDSLYDWLGCIFAFCEGGTMAYASQYRPGKRIYKLATSYNVDLLHIPLGALPEALLAVNSAYRSMRLSVGQWRELRDRLSAAGRSDEAALLTEHLAE